MRANRGDFTTRAPTAPSAARTPAENLARFREMRDGQHGRTALMVLRAKIDMASPNINLRDPAIYRIKRATHHNTGDRWCIYPMYTYAHPIEDALENITHSICTLEFEDQRPFYDWLLDLPCTPTALSKWPRPLPAVRVRAAQPHLRHHQQAQAQAARRRRPRQRLGRPAHAHHRRPAPPRLHARGDPALGRAHRRVQGRQLDRLQSLDIALRDDLDPKATARMAVLDPLKLKLTNWDEVFGIERAGHLRALPCPGAPAHPEQGASAPVRADERGLDRARGLQEVPSKGFFRLFPAQHLSPAAPEVRLRDRVQRLREGRRTGASRRCWPPLVPDTKSGTPGADSVKVKGVITWVSVATGVAAEVRLYDRLFTEAQPDAGGRDFKTSAESGQQTTVTAYVEPSLACAHRTDR
jgi:glutaminyl-tRNA synthetase